jgi:tetratricopeptide (TPR) repeat protein
MYTKEERRLAGPTGAVITRPESYRNVEMSIETSSPDLAADGVSAIVHQAAALVDRHPGSPTAWARLAHAHLAAARFEDARRAAYRAIADDIASEDASAIVAAATVLVSINDNKGAEAALAKLGGRVFPHLYAQLAAERNEWAVATSRLEGFTDGPSTAMRGWIQLQCHQYTGAVHTFRSMIASGQIAPDVYLNLGYAYGVLGSLSKAIDATRIALGMVPASRTAAFNLAAFNSAAGQSDSALSTLKTIAQYYPDELAPRLAVASTYARFGDLQGAERELRRALADRVGWAASPAERATLKANLIAVQQAQGKLTASSAYSQVLTLVRQQNFEDVRVARLLLGWLHSTKQSDAAEQLLLELSRRHPPQLLGAFRTQLYYLREDFRQSIIEARQWVLDLLIEVDDAVSEAVQIGRSALNRMPGEVTIRNNVAYGLALLGDLEGARKLLNSPRSNDHPLIMATRGFVEIQTGNIEKGILTYSRAAEQADGLKMHDVAELIRERSRIEAAIAGDGTVLAELISVAAHEDDPRFRLNALRLARSARRAVR